MHWSHLCHWSQQHRLLGLLSIVLFVFCLFADTDSKSHPHLYRKESLADPPLYTSAFDFFGTSFHLSSAIRYRNEFPTILPIMHSLWSDLYMSFLFYYSTTHTWPSRLWLPISQKNLFVPSFIFPSKSPNVEEDIEVFCNHHFTSLAVGELDTESKAMTYIHKQQVIWNKTGRGNSGNEVAT